MVFIPDLRPAVENSSYMQGRLPLIHLGSRLSRAIKKSLVTFVVGAVILQNFSSLQPGRVAQSVGHLTRK